MSSGLALVAEHSKKFRCHAYLNFLMQRAEHLNFLVESGAAAGEKQVMCLDLVGG